MLDSARRAARIAAGLSERTLAADEVRLLAIVKSIEIIGEASTKVSDAARNTLPALDWRGMRLMRNRLIHGYDTIDAARVWDALAIDVPPLIAELERALANWPPAPPRSEQPSQASPP